MCENTKFQPNDRPVSDFTTEPPLAQVQHFPKYSESESPTTYSSFLVTTRLSRLVSEIDTQTGIPQTDKQTTRTITNLLISWPPHCGKPANKS